jgi:hypothetical protein
MAPDVADAQSGRYGSTRPQKSARIAVDLIAAGA